MGKSFISKNIFCLALLITMLAGCLEANRYRYPASVHNHQTGKAKPDSTSWIVGTGDKAGYMSFGPYTTELPEGMVQAIFGLKTDSVSDPNRNVLYIDVHETNSNKVLASREIYLRDFDSQKLTGIFTLNFLNSLKNRIEFRIYYKGVGNFEHVETAAVGLSDSYKFAQSPAYGFNLTIWKYDSGQFGANPTSPEEGVLRRNLSQMASLGTKYVRVMILNQSSGFQSVRKQCDTPTQGCQGATLDYSVMDKVILNFTKDGGILDIANEYGIKIIPMFSANGFYWDAWSWSYHWWDSYGASQAGFNKWVADATTWVNRIASGIDASPKAARSIYYYDLWNEFDHYSDRQNLPPKSGLIRSLIQNVNISPDRRGLSMIFVCGVPEEVKRISDSLSKPIKFVEVHSYPEKTSQNDSCGTNDLRAGEKIEKMKQNFPGATYLLGEYAAAKVDDEDEHAEIDLATYLGPSSARSSGVVAALRWVLWDDSAEGKWGLGENIDKPRNTYGRYTDLPLHNVIESGGDFERINSERHWEMVGTDSSFERVVGMRNDAATGKSFLRFRVKKNTDRLCTPEMEPTGKKNLFLSGYFRQSDPSSSYLTFALKVDGKFVQPISISNFNYQTFKSLHAFYPRGVKFNVDGMKTIQLCISTTGASAKSTLDIDAISLNGI